MLFSYLLFLAYGFFIMCQISIVSGNNTNYLRGALNKNNNEISAFLSVGDWGGTALDKQHSINAVSVAKQMIIDNDMQPYDVPYEFVCLR